MSDILTNKDGNLRLELKEDRLSAWLTILETGKLIDETEILELLERAGIKNGFEEALRLIRKQGLEKEFGVPFPVAVCNYVKGESKLEYYFDLQQAKGFAGSVGVEELPRLICIEAGTVIAAYNSNIFARTGSIYDIYGEMIQDDELDEDEAQKLAGDNVRYDPSRSHYIAICTGYLSADEAGRLSIYDNLLLAGDIDSHPDTLRTPVNITITGSVRNSALKAQKNIIIQGDLESSTLYCGGDLQVDGSIRNCRRSNLQVLGDLRCHSVFSSALLCCGKLEFSGEVRDSEVVAEAGITSANGSLSGGHIQSCGDIRIAVLGSPEQVPTEIEITISPYYKTLLMQLTKDLIHLKQDEAASSEAIAALEEQIKQCESELDSRLNIFLHRDPDQRIRLEVRDDVFPPLQIRILKHEYQIKHHQIHLELIEKE